QKLKQLEKEMETATTEEEKEMKRKKMEDEKRIIDQVHYAVNHWPVKKFPIDGFPMPYCTMSREQALFHLGLSNSEPKVFDYGDFTVRKLDQLYKMKCMKERTIREGKNNIEDSTRMEERDREKEQAAPRPIKFVPITSQPMTSTPKPVTTKVSRLPMEEDTELPSPIPGETTEEEMIPGPSTEDLSDDRLSPEEKLMRSEEELREQKMKLLELQKDKSTPSDYVVAMMRKISLKRFREERDDEDEEGEPQEKKRKENNVRLTIGDANLDNEASSDESAILADEDELMAGEHVEVIDECDETEELREQEVLSGEEDGGEGRIDEEGKGRGMGGADERSEADPAYCEDTAGVSTPTNGNVTPNDDDVDSTAGDLTATDEDRNAYPIAGSDDDDDLDNASEVTEPMIIDPNISCAQILSVTMNTGLDLETVSSGSVSVASNDHDYPNNTAYHLPARGTSSFSDDYKDDKTLLALQEEGVGIPDEEGGIVGEMMRNERRRNQRDPNEPKMPSELVLFNYMTKGRLDDDLLSSQRHLMHFSDIIVNKILSEETMTNPAKWALHFYNVKYSEVINRTYEPVPPGFEKNLLKLRPNEEFIKWLNGREITEELIGEAAMKSDDENVMKLLNDTFTIKDSFSLVRAKQLFRSIVSETARVFSELANREEDEDREKVMSLGHDTVEHLKKIFCLSFFVIKHQLKIENQWRKTSEYQLARVYAFVLEGWCGWMERGGIYRIFVTICANNEKKNLFVPRGKEEAERMRDKIESRISRILAPLHAIDTDIRAASMYYLKEMGCVEEFTPLFTAIIDKKNEGRTFQCGANLGAGRKGFCRVSFYSEEQVELHKEVTHKRRAKENPKARKCRQCARYFLMETSLELHRLVSHHDYDDEDEEDMEEISKITEGIQTKYEEMARQWAKVKQEAQSPTTKR
ncbi:hypothetical protein PFISCL1PPCAC_24277, partial [Pristionchus fissidentatus]